MAVRLAAIPAGHVEIPTIRLPRNGRYRWVSACYHCGASRDNVRVSLPYGADLGDATCLLCSRVQAELAPPLLPLPAMGEDEGPRRGRPPRPLPDGPAAHRCADCSALIQTYVFRCGECLAERRRRGTVLTRLLAVLADGRPHRRIDLCAELDTREGHLYVVVTRARKAGHRIVSDGTSYRLEVGS